MLLAGFSSGGVLIGMGKCIYVAIFNHFGNLEQLANELGARAVEGTLCFSDLKGQQISDLMERFGLDYNCGRTPESAMNCIEE